MFDCSPTVRCAPISTPENVIFREGEAANRSYLIERGKIALESSTLGEPVRIEEIGDVTTYSAGGSELVPPYA